MSLLKLHRVWSGLLVWRMGTTQLELERNGTVYCVQHMIPQDVMFIREGRVSLALHSLIASLWLWRLLKDMRHGEGYCSSIGRVELALRWSVLQLRLAT